MKSHNSNNTDIIRSNSLPVLLEIYKLLERSPYSPDILNPALMILADQFNFEDAIITISDPTSKEIYIEASYGMSDIQRTRGRYLLGEGIIGKVVQSKSEIIVPRIGDEPQFLNRAKNRDNKEAVSFICVPIKDGDYITGTLSVSLPFHQDADLSELANLLSVIAFMLLQPIILRKKLTVANKKIAEHANQQKKILPLNTESIIGSSTMMREIKQHIRLCATKETPIFIYGESGSGKTYIANIIHNMSLKKSNDIVQYDCNMFPTHEHLYRLFGNYIDDMGLGTDTTTMPKHLQGSTPVIARANNSTLLLENIDVLPPVCKEALLHMMKSHDLLIEGKIKKLSIHYIFTSSYSLLELLKNQQITQNLYESLVDNCLTIPPLRNHKEDIILFADMFLQDINTLRKNITDPDKLPRRLSTPAIDLLTHYHWPGNLNELYHAMESASNKSTGGVLHAHMFPPSLQSAESTNTQNQLGLFIAVERLEKDLIIDALKTTNGHLIKTAKILKVSDRILGLRIKKYNIHPKQYK